MKHSYPSMLSCWLARPLAALGLLLATTSAAQAQQPALVADPTLPGSPNPNLVAPARTAAHVTARPATTQRLVTGWTTMAAMSQVRAEPGAAAHPNGKIYVWGGYGSGGPTDALASAEAYTPATNTWAAIASLPLALSGPATAVGTDGAIYSFGGRNSGAYYNNCYKYDVTANLWTAIAPLPVTRWEARALTAPDGRIFVFGGWNFSITPDVGSDVQIYTPATNTWSTGATMPAGLFGSAVGVDAAGLMHVYGGITTNLAPATTHLVYNVTTNSWATAPATPTPARAYTTGLAGPDGNLYLFGGDDNIPFGTAGAYYSQVDSYDPATATWSNEPALPVALTEAASATTGGNLYVVGGFNSTAQGALYRIAVVAAPTLTSISPNPAAAGTSVTLTGTDLSGATAVTFTGTSNNTVTTGLTVSGTGSSQTLTVAVPTGASSGPVTVTTPGGVSNGVAFAVTTTVASINRVGSSPTNAASVSYTVTFAAAVTGLSASNFALATTGSVAGASITGVSGAGTTYTVAVSTGTGDGTLGLNLVNAAGISPGLSTTLPFVGQAYTLDKTAPTVVFTSSTAPDGGYTTTSPLVYVLTFSEDVSAPVIRVTNVSGGSITRTSASTFTVSATPAGPGAVTLTVVANTAIDAAGNGSPAATYTIFYNVPTTAPVVTTPANNSTTNGAPTFAGTAPAGSTVTVYLVSGGTTTTLGTTTATGGSFSLVPASALASGSYSVYATALLSGQAVSANSKTNAFTVDATAPTVTVTSATVANGGSTSTSPVSILLTFSEDVRPTGAFGGFNLAAGVTNAVVSGIRSISSRVYELTVSPRSSGLVTVSLGANAALDVVGNGNLATPVLYSFTALPAPVAGDVSVQYQTGDLGQPTDGQVRPFLQLVNSGTTAVPYSGLTVRYWLTVENFLGQLVTPIDYAKLGTSFVSARYVALATPRQGAFGYIEYSFSAGAGSLAPGTDSGPIFGKAYKPSYSDFDETDDWSYQTSSSFTTNSHVTVYQDGTLVNGTEPPAVAATTDLQVFAASRDAAASTSAVGVQLQVRNTGNVPVNYADLKVRYYLTRDGASTLVANIDYAKLGASNLGVRVVNLAAPVSGADAYVEFTFAAALGVFYPRTSTEDILAKLRRDDYGPLDQTNDYSFSGSTALALNNRIPAYLSNQLVFGTPPAGAPAVVAPTTEANARATGPADASIVAAADALPELTFTGSPNPFTDQLRLTFALPTTQAYTLALYDGQGRLVQQLAHGQAEAGQAQELAVPTQGYAAGLYLVRLTTATGVQHLKLIKQ